MYATAVVLQEYHTAASCDGHDDARDYLLVAAAAAVKGPLVRCTQTHKHKQQARILLALFGDRSVTQLHDGIVLPSAPSVCVNVD